MKTVSCPNLNRETTYFPSFFTSLEQPDHDDTTLEERPKIDHSADTEASETSPCKHIILPFNEIGLLAAPSSIVMFGPGSEQKDQTLQSPSSVDSNQFSGDFYLDFPEDEFRHNPAAPTNAVVHVGLVGTTTTSSPPLPPSRCKTLGGHRASHKNPRLTPGNRDFFPKTHECSICGLEFAIGQALGGHMRRHRPAGGHMRRYRPVVAAAVSGHEKAVGSEKRDTSLDLNLTLAHNFFVVVGEV